MLEKRTIAAAMSRSGRPLKQKQVKARCIPAAFAGWRVSSFIEGLPNGFNCRVAIIAKPDSLRRHSGVRSRKAGETSGGFRATNFSELG